MDSCKIRGGREREDGRCCVTGIRMWIIFGGKRQEGVFGQEGVEKDEEIPQNGELPENKRNVERDRESPQGNWEIRRSQTSNHPKSKNLNKEKR